jgi:hypothetical protein
VTDNHYPNRWPKIATKPQISVWNTLKITVPFHTNNGLTLEARSRQLLEAARTDNVDLLSDIFAKPGEYDINFQDGWVSSPSIKYMFPMWLTKACSALGIQVGKIRKPCANSNDPQFGGAALHYA